MNLLCGLLIALFGSLFIYLAHFEVTLPWIETLTALGSLALLLLSGTRVWFWSGFFFGLFWFWWIGLSFIHYHMPWAIPIVILVVSLVYGGVFWLIARTALSVERLAFRTYRSVALQCIPSLLTLHPKGTCPYGRAHSSLFTLIPKALGLLGLSYLHPLSFDWFKPELMFVQTPLGIEKWQFAVILATLVLALWRKNILFLLLLIAAYDPHIATHTSPSKEITLVTTHTPVEEKWDKQRHPAQFRALLAAIDQAIEAHAHLIVLPESVFPVFLMRDPTLLSALKARAKKINIVTGALYWDGKTPRNATYIFTTDGKIRIANKVVLVPFGEANPLPDFLSDWVNHIFYDDAVDYKADANVTDYTIEGKTYRNAICFEATSERLYEGRPERMIVLSNDGWFTPSIEPTLQRLLLQYYTRKYGTTIYHAVNMAPSYVIDKSQRF